MVGYITFEISFFRSRLHALENGRLTQFEQNSSAHFQDINYNHVLYIYI